MVLQIDGVDGCLIVTRNKPDDRLTRKLLDLTQIQIDLTPTIHDNLYLLSLDSRVDRNFECALSAANGWYVQRQDQDSSSDWSRQLA